MSQGRQGSAVNRTALVLTGATTAQPGGAGAQGCMCTPACPRPTAGQGPCSALTALAPSPAAGLLLHHASELPSRSLLSSPQQGSCPAFREKQSSQSKPDIGLSLPLQLLCPCSFELETEGANLGLGVTMRKELSGAQHAWGWGDQYPVLWGPGCAEPGTRLAALGLPCIVPWARPRRLAGKQAVGGKGMGKTRQTKGWQHSLQPQSSETVLGTTMAPSRPASADGHAASPAPAASPASLGPCFVGMSCPATALRQEGCF